MKVKIELEKEDLPSIADAIFNALDLFDLPDEKIIEYWDMLPEDIQLTAAMYGTSDTEVREKMYDWFVDNLIAYKSDASEIEPNDVPSTYEPESDDLKPIVNTIDDAVSFFYPAFKEIESIILEKDEDSFAAFCHSQLSNGVGMQIRNTLRLWEPETPLHQEFVTKHNLTHPDDMSDFIIRVVYNIIKIENSNNNNHGI